MPKTKWTLVDVVSVYFLRLVLGAIFARFVLPILGIQDYLSLQVVDSSILILLVAFFLKRRKNSIKQMFRIDKFKLSILLGWGGGAGLLFLFLGNWAETWLSNNLMLDLGAHPLVNYAMQADRAGQFILPFLTGGFLVPAAEEIFYRGFLFPPLAERIGPCRGIILTALVFALVHLNKSWFVEIFLVGIVLTWLYQRFQTIWPCFFTHIILNAGRLIMIYLAI